MYSAGLAAVLEANVVDNHVSLEYWLWLAELLYAK